MSQGEVVRFRGRGPCLAAHEGTGKRSRCFHRHTALVDARAREVTCSACGASLDPIQVLARLAAGQLAAERRAGASDRLAGNLRWLLEQKGGRLSVTRRRGIVISADGVTSTSSNGLGSVEERIDELITRLRSRTEWLAKRKAAGGAR